MNRVTIVCDGSSLGNGKGNPCCAVAVLGFKGIWKAFGEYLGRATNQQSEIAAAALGLENLKEPCSVRLLSDSRYVVETMGGTWKRKANHDWWARLDRAAARHEVSWEWVKGHAGHEVQEVADKAARKIAAAGSVDADALDELASDLGLWRSDPAVSLGSFSSIFFDEFRH
ncbi:MAG: ribonuclease HI [Chloracidobacterium sp.]|nr:ribonuclease HI [Chloracidobacterium sp.]